MLRHTRSSFDVPDNLLAKARRVARRRGLSMRDLVEEGLRRVLEEEETPPFELRDCSFGGEGSSPEFAERGWEAIRAAIYEGRGG